MERRNALRAWTVAMGLGLIAVLGLSQPGPFQRPASLPPMEWLPAHTVPAPPVASLLEEDRQRGRDRVPQRVALPLALDLDVMAQAVWHQTGDGTRFGRVRIESPGALFLSVKFSRFRLPEGAQLRFISMDRQQELGPYTADDNRPEAVFGTPMVAGARMVVELVLPATTPAPELRIASVSYGYRDALGLSSLPARDGAAQPGAPVTPYAPGDFTCQRDINCPEGAPYQVDKRAVAEGYDGTFVCSGTMINNTQGDCTYLYITADHCEWWLDPPTMVYYHRYENSGCATNDATWQTSTGSISLYHSPDADVSLMQLTGSGLHTAQQLYFAGWDRTPSAPSAGAVISFPSDKPKQIAIMGTPILDCASASCPNGWGTNWFRINSYDVGVTEGGSSGGGLLDENHRLRGVLTGGVGSDCASFSWDEYGKIYAVWSSLQPFLDPGNSGVLFLDGKDYPVCACPMTVDVNPATLPAVCLGADRVLTATPSGGTAPYTYQWTEDGVNLSDGPRTSGSQTATLTISKTSAQTHQYNCKVTDASGICIRITDVMPTTAAWAACGPNIAFQSASGWTQLFGNGDAVMDPGESWSVDVTLVNDGIAAATAVQASLSSGAAALCTVSRDYGDLGVGGTATRTFSFHVSAALACGNAVPFDVIDKASNEAAYFDEASAFNSGTGGPGAAQVSSAANFTAPASATTTRALSPSPTATPIVSATAGYTAATWSSRVLSAVLRHVGSADTIALPLPTGDGVAVSQDVTAFYQAHGPGAYEMSWTIGNHSVSLTNISLSVSPLTCNTWNGAACSAPAGPPPVADGLAGTGTGITLSKVSGNTLHVTWDATTCAADHAVILYGALGDFSDYAGDVGTGCNAGASGSADFDFSGTDAWFNLVWVNASGAAGHPGNATSGARTWTAASLCGAASDDPSDATCN